MSTYSIKDLERLTNIKAHTLRIWEKRYGIVEPPRSETNIRHYTDEDLKKLLNVSILNRHGIKISRIARMSNYEINQKILEVIRPESDYLSQIEGLVVAMIELNEERFERILNQSIIKIGFEESLFHVVYPFFEKVGVLWQTGTINPAQEHFISNLIRMKLFVAIDSLPRVYDSSAKTLLMFLPEWELHEIGLLTYYYLSRKNGYRAIYLGQNVPINDLFSVAGTVKPDVLATYFVSAITQQEMKDYIMQLSEHFGNQQLLISGIQAANIQFELPVNTRIISSALEFKQVIRMLARD
ncbi:MAG TPA: MerR family transcriptional regulator [Bacteroidales bacterium]|nr:MerR family transcriptional regulator [Bacteroidales bacterium]